jgi:hypothetical protein
MLRRAHRQSREISRRANACEVVYAQALVGENAVNNRWGFDNRVKLKAALYDRS